jgi:exopolysaccharide biosynthesis polyprenyl glycosylphosphotransferase
MGRSKRFYSLVQLLIDLLVIYFSYFICIYIKNFFGKPYNSINITSIEAFVPYVAIAYLLLFLIYRLYEISTIDFYETFLGIFFSTLIIFILGFALPFFLRVFAVPRTVIIYSFIIQFILLVLLHWIVNKIYINIMPHSKVLLLSKDDSEAKTVSEYVGNIRTGRTSVELMIVEGKDSLKNVEEVLNTFHLFVIDDSFTLEEKSELLKIFAYRDKSVYLVPGVYELLLLNPRTHIVNDLTLFEINLVNSSSIERVVKRAIDIIVSLVALIVFSPVILFVSLSILFDSGRPVFFLQERAGVNGKTFKTIKFRTMIKDAEKYTGPVLSSEDDPRITKVGKFLRKAGFDEILQFINVLKGDLSVVGPRPERPELMEKIQKDMPNFDMRLKVRPGITGFAQLHGKYDTPSDDKLKMDLLYAKQKNVILTDIYVMFNTVKLFLLPKKRK